MQSGVIIDPNVTRIDIIDDDGNYTRSSIILLTNFINSNETSDVVIGFVNAPYQAVENESFVTVTLGVINGDLEREVTVELSFLDGTAVGESLKLQMF
jgi:collagen type VI alpha